MNKFGIQSIRRAIVFPNFRAPTLQDEIANIERAYSELAQELVTIHNSIESNQYAVPGATGSLAVVLDAPFSDANYSPQVTLSWNAYAYITAISATGYTATFSANSPGGGGTMYAIVIR